MLFHIFPPLPLKFVCDGKCIQMFLSPNCLFAIHLSHPPAKEIPVPPGQVTNTQACFKFIHTVPELPFFFGRNKYNLHTTFSTSSRTQSTLKTFPFSSSSFQVGFTFVNKICSFFPDLFTEKHGGQLDVSPSTGQILPPSGGRQQSLTTPEYTPARSGDRQQMRNGQSGILS